MEFAPGMTVITGETGAGKSILLGALGQALGDKAEADRVRQGATRADIAATFDTQRIRQAQEWLVNHDPRIRECVTISVRACRQEKSSRRAS